MKTIYKYPILIEDEQTVEVPVGSEILSVGVQNDRMFLWAAVDTAVQGTVGVPILIYATGQEIEADLDDLFFIGTVLLYQGTLVYHIFTKE